MSPLTSMLVMKKLASISTNNAGEGKRILAFIATQHFFVVQAQQIRILLYKNGNPDSSN